MCKCNPGFILLEDKITCAPIVANISENLIADKEKSVCPKGYVMDLVSLTCVDVDECDTGEADCDINTQICRNEVGSYKCVDVIPPSSEDCKPGFRFNVGTEACEGRFVVDVVTRVVDASDGDAFACRPFSVWGLSEITRTPNEIASIY